MPYPKFWTTGKLNQLKSLYDSGLSMKEVAVQLHTTLGSINHIMRRSNIPRRLASTTNHLQFVKSPLSFHPKTNLSLYQIDEKRLRVYLYTYNSLPTQELITYWSKLTQIPATQFTKPYIRAKSNLIHDKMQYGLIHIRYADLRLFNLIMSEIKQFEEKIERFSESSLRG